MLNKQEIINLINSLLPDNDANLISAEDLRTVLSAMNNSDANLIDNNNLLGLSEYDTSFSYSEGQCVVYGGIIYQANSQSSIGSFNPAQWNQITESDFADYALKQNTIELDNNRRVKTLANNYNFNTLDETGIWLVNNTDGNYNLSEVYPIQGKSILEIYKRDSDNETLYKLHSVNFLDKFFLKRKSDTSWTEFKSQTDNNTTSSNGLTKVGNDIRDGGEFNVIEKSGNFYTLSTAWELTLNALLTKIQTGEMQVTTPTWSLGLGTGFDATISGDSTTINMWSENLNISTQTINSAGIINHGGTIQYTDYVYADGITNLQVPYWGKIVEFVGDATGGLPSVQNGLSIEDSTIKLGGVLTDDNTRLTVDSPGKNLFIGAPINGQDLQFISLSSTVFNINNAVDHDTVQGNTMYITPGGLNSINQYLSGVQTVINGSPDTVSIRYSDNKVFKLHLFGGLNSGETLTINDITFTEGVDFYMQGDRDLDVEHIIDTLPWNTIPNFLSVKKEFDEFNEPVIVVSFSEISTITHTISNLSISSYQNEKRVLVDADGVLLKSRNNEITLTDTDTNINSKNVNIIQKNEEGVIKNTVFSNSYGSFLWNADSTDSSVSSSSVVGNFGSNISNSNNRKIGLSIVGEILSGESFTVNGITFTEGIDFTTVNDPNLDALAISEIDYSSVPNFISVSVETNFITFTFSVVDNTITTTISNVYVVNYLSNSSVFAGKNFAAIQSNNSELRIGYEGHTFTDNTSEKQGLKYFEDYSATYTDRSLVDKAYADSLNNVLEYANLASLPVTGESGKIYVTLDTNKIYRWSGSVYVELSNMDILGLQEVTDISSTTTNPITANKFITDGGTISQYVAGDGTLVTFPSLLQADRVVTLVRNQSGATLTAGTVVYISGATGNKPLVSKAQANLDTTSDYTFGLIQSDISNNADGYVVVSGNLVGLDTSAYIEGTSLWLSPSVAGTFTSTKPTQPNHSVFIAIVTRQHVTLGSVEIKIINGQHLADLHDTLITSPANNQALIYENSTGLWKNKEITSVGTITSGTWNGSVIDSAYLPSYVDDVLEFANLVSLPVTGETGKIYVTLDTNKIYRWSGSVYVEISSSTIPNLQAVTDVSSSTTNNITANGFVKSGGTSSQFLKADGSVDSNTYLTSNQTITLSGDISGSGTTAITTSIGAGKVTNTMLAGSIDLATKVTGVLPSNLGGTGVANNPAYTITLGGAITTSNNVIIGSSNHTVSLNTTGATSITLPTTGTVSTLAGTETLTNKRVTTRTGTTTSSATPAINTDNFDFYSITALAVNITSFTMSGTPTDGQKLWIAITGTAARTIAWGTSFEASTIALPTTTVGTARLDVGFIWNTATSKWRCVGAC